MTDIAIIIGGGMGVWSELNDARELLGNREAKLIACNHAGRDAGDHVDHWATIHSELMPMWIKARRDAGRPDAGQLWHARHRIVKGYESSPVESWGGSSGLLCVKLALDLGMRKIILCGVPMHQNFYHYDKPGRRWSEAAQYHRACEKRLPEMLGKVKSMSGQTQKWLGMPDRAWIDGNT